MTNQNELIKTIHFMKLINPELRREYFYFTTISNSEKATLYLDLDQQRSETLKYALFLTNSVLIAFLHLQCYQQITSAYKIYKLQSE